MEYRLSKEYLWKELGDQVVVLHFESGRYFSLNDSASLIWKGLLENQTSEKIIAGLCAAFEVDEKTAGEDVLAMTQDFLQKNFLVAG
jgi:hypothetical protein